MDDQFPQGIPTQPAPGPYVQAAPPPIPFPPVVAAPPSGRPTREAMKAARLRESQGVPFELKEEPRGEVMIKAQTFADKTLWLGVPSGLQAQISQAFNQAQARQKNRKPDRTFDELMTLAAADEEFANAICMAVFVEPRLVASEYELASNPGAWVVDDIHLNDRLRVLQWVQGTRKEEDLQRVAEFQRRHTRVENSSDRGGR